MTFESSNLGQVEFTVDQIRHDDIEDLMKICPELSREEAETFIKKTTAYLACPKWRNKVDRLICVRCEFGHHHVCHYPKKRSVQYCKHHLILRIGKLDI